jgi:hypothetical protein
MSRNIMLARLLILPALLLACTSSAGEFRVPLSGLLEQPLPGQNYLASAYDFHFGFREIETVRIELKTTDWSLTGGGTGNSSFFRWVYGGIHDLADPVDLQQFHVPVLGTIDTGDPSNPWAHGLWRWFSYQGATLAEGFTERFPEFLYSGRGKAVLQEVAESSYHPIGGDPSTFTTKESRLSPRPPATAHLVIVGTPIPEPSGSMLAVLAVTWGFAKAVRRRIDGQRF